MNLELDIIELYNKINKRNFIINENTLIKELVKTFEVMDEVSVNLINYTGLEKNDEYGLINPLLWEYGHTLHFWEHIVLSKMGFYNVITNDNHYNSFLINRKDRFNKKNLLSLEEIVIGYKNVIEFIYNHINKYHLNKVNSYLIRLGQLHLEMHNESFIFTNQLLGHEIYNDEFSYPFEEILDNIEFIDINGGVYIQGSNPNTFNFYFDNESPSFTQYVESFQVSKYCITNSQFLKFVEDDGYNKKQFWTTDGFSFIKKKKINYPIYWIKTHNTWCEKIFNKVILLRMNHPVVHISWHEAMAFCKWNNCRLLYEKEWEYLADLDNCIKKLDCNLNYGKNYSCHSTISVLKDKSKNNLGVVGLFGNCWEWCLEPLYPYDGFVIDPAYREMSYPHFGYKRICRGGSWAVPDFLINKSYRNAQPSDCCHQYIGFRVARNFLQ